MCFNFAFIPIIYFFFPETNGHKLERLDAIFTEAYEKGENPVFAEKRLRKRGGTLDVEQRADSDWRAEGGEKERSDKEGEKDVEFREGT